MKVPEEENNEINATTIASNDENSNSEPELESESESEMELRLKKLKMKKKLKMEAKKANMRGVCYLSRIPPHMDHVKLRQLLSQFGDIQRIYLAPQGHSFSLSICSTDTSD